MDYLKKEIHCKNEMCVFHEFNFVVPGSEQASEASKCCLAEIQDPFMIERNGQVYSCINYIKDKKQLSKEGTDKLMKIFQKHPIIKE